MMMPYKYSGWAKGKRKFILSNKKIPEQQNAALGFFCLANL
jgi:hypothetical protein